MMKYPLGAAAIALTMVIGAPSLSADGWRGAAHRGYSHHGYSRHYGQYQPRPSYSQPRYSWHRSGSSYYGPPRGYDGGYERRAIYNAGFNQGAEAQWRIAYQRWAYEYAEWRQTRGPTGIFALGAGLAGGGGYSGGYGEAYGNGGGYAGRGYGGAGYGSQCDCE
jgi:hypothetical protein